MVRFSRVLGALLILAMAAADVEPAAHEGVAPESLCPNECRVVRISGADKLCLFNCFARDTEFSATVLRRVVCEFMHGDKDMVMADDGTTVREFFLRESSTFESLTEANVAREGAGLAVVRSPRPTRRVCRRRARSPARTATASASARGARTATATARVATERSSRRPGARAGEPAMSRTSARPGELATSRTSAQQGARAGEPATSRSSAWQIN